MRRWLAVGVLAALGVVLSAPGASAHALVSSSSPSDGEQFDAAPSEVSILFTEEPELSFSSIQVLDQQGAPVQRGETQRAGDASTLRVGLPDLPTGVYTVTWRVVSRVDGHATGGAFAFGVGVSPVGAVLPQAAAPSDPAPTPLEVAGRWGLYVGLGLVLGAAWVAVAAFEQVRRSTLVLLAAGWGVAIMGLVSLAEAQRRAAEASYGDISSTPIGRALIGRAVGLAVAVVAIAVARRAQGRTYRIALITAALASAAAMFVHSSAGHAGAGDLRWLQIASQWIHFVAAGVWLGGLAALMAGIRGEPSIEKARAIRRFSFVAGIMLLVVAASGTARTVTALPAVSALWESWYGRVVLIKVGLIVLLAVFGGLNRYRYVPMSESKLAGLRRISRVELLLAVLVLIAAGSLATLSPPRDAAAAAAQVVDRLTASGTDFGRTIQVDLTVTPGFAGPNGFSVKVGTPAGDPIDARRVALTFTYLDDPSLGTSTLELEPAGDGVYQAPGSNLSLDGTWKVSVLVQQETDSVEIQLEVATRCRVTALPQPGAPTLYNGPLAGGNIGQMYVEPGTAGSNEIHVTYFDAEGDESRIGRIPVIVGRTSDQSAVAFNVRRLSAGHFVAGAELMSGDWRFEMSVAGPSRARFRSCFEETIE